MKRSLVCLLLCAVLCVGLLSPGALAYDAGSEASAAFRAFVLDEGFRDGRAYSSSAEYPVCFSLYDLDGDRQPELLIRDRLRAMAEEPYDVFTCRGGTVTYIGRLGVRGGEAHYAPGSDYPGLFSYDGAMGFYIGNYYTMRDGSVVSERVVETDGRSGGALKDAWITADEALRAAFRSAYDGPVTDYSAFAELPAFTMEEIADMGWEQYYAGSGAAARFYDVAVKSFYAPAVAWAVGEEITNGMRPAEFVPDAVCTRAQMVTFLWRAAGSPDEGTKTPFRDVPESAWYAPAVAWAAKTGVALGMTPESFAPASPVTRGQTVTFLWRFAGSPKQTGGELPFLDVRADAYYAEAVRWALAKGVTNGTEPGYFRPARECARREIVTFLYRHVTGQGVTLEPVSVRHLAPGETPRADYSFRDEGAESSALITLARDLKDVMLLRAETTDGGLRVTGEPLKRFGDLKTGAAIFVETSFPDVGARVALRYTLDGKTVTVAIAESGRDGKLILIPVE